MKPSVGSIVHYNLRGQYIAAIVAKVREKES